MSSLAQSFLETLERGGASAELLAEAGEPDPPKAAAALASAAAHADLASTRSTWLPPILSSARPGFAAQTLEELAQRYRAACGEALEPARYPALPRLLGCSDFLARLLLRHPNWLEELAGELPDAPPATQPAPDWTAIRVAKYKGLLRIAARDLHDRPFRESLRELSDLADRCLAAALQCTAETLDHEAPAMLALGKLGGTELNFSSDVDLLFVYEPSSDPPDPADRPGLTKFIQTFKKHLEAPSEDGFGYRVDLDLRPEGRAGALVNPLEAALEYYESFGADWERQALIRLRHLAGSAATGRAFEQQVVPFVYRQLIDPGSIGAIRDMKLRIESERRSAGSNLELELKEGPGGIRDVEFLVQAFQLLFGGRYPQLRTGNVLDALDQLRAESLLPEHVIRALADAYLWLRRAEHCVQLPEERQTQRFPAEPQQQTALARRMGYSDDRGTSARDRLLDDWTRVRSEVRMHFDALTLEAPHDAGA